MTALARDLRFGGSWTLGQALKNHLLYGLARATLALGVRLPKPALRRAGRALGAAAYAISGARARANVRLALALSEAEAARVARVSFENLGAHLGDLVAVLGGAPFELLPIAPDALDCIAEARAEGRGVLFVSAHLGPWERVAATLLARGVPLVSVARESYDPRLDRVYDALRSRSGLRCIYRGKSGASIRILRALREGRVLGLPMDLRTRAPSVMVPFFGRPAATVIGPARLALRTGAPVVVSTLEGRKGKSSAITATRLQTEPDIERMTAALNAEIERRIRTLPEEWLWLHPRW